MRVLMLERPDSAATFGGEQVHLRKLSTELSALGVVVDVATDAIAAGRRHYDIVHLWNIQHPLETQRFLRELRQHPAPKALTPIYADLRRGIFAHRVQEHLAQFTGAELDRKLDQLARRRLAVHGATSYQELPADPVYHDARTEILQGVDALFPLTGAEADAIAEDVGPLPGLVQVTPVAPENLPVAPECVSMAPESVVANPQAFRDHARLEQPFVLIPAARIEPNKNQWLTLHALGQLSLPVVVTGTFTSPVYEQLCRQAAPRGARFVGLLAPDLLASALAAAQAVVHVSPIECSSLVAMSAAAANGNLVLGNSGTEGETFAGLARVVDPLDIRAIHREVQRTLCSGPQQEHRSEQLRQHVKSSYSWRASAMAMVETYERLLQKRRAPSPSSSSSSSSSSPSSPSSPSQPVSQPIQQTVQPASQEPRLPHVHFRGAVLGPSGFASEGREWLAALEQAGFLPSLHGAQLGSHGCELPTKDQQRIERCAERQPQQPRITFHHSLVPHFEPDAGAALNILHTVFETEALPEGWAEVVNRADLVLVMTEWNRQVFLRSGVDAARLRLLPPPIDAAIYRPRSSHPSSGPCPANPGPFRWLTVMDWQLRKGHDILLPAFARAFGHGEAELWIKTTPHAHLDRQQLQSHCETVLARSAVGKPPAVRVLDDVLTHDQLLALYRGADGLVLPSRGEGWGRPVHEAMLMELPVVVSHGSALRTLVPDRRVGYPVPCKLVPVSEEAARETPSFRDQLWHEPDIDSLVQCLRQVVADPAEARTRGQRGRAHIQRLCNPESIRRRLRSTLVEECRLAAAAR